MSHRYSYFKRCRILYKTVILFHFPPEGADWKLRSWARHRHTRAGVKKTRTSPEDNAGPLANFPLKYKVQALARAHTRPHTHTCVTFSFQLPIHSAARLIDAYLKYHKPSEIIICARTQPCTRMFVWHTKAALRQRREGGWRGGGDACFYRVVNICCYMCLSFSLLPTDLYLIRK